MKILINTQWREGFLDQTLQPGFVRIAVQEWYNLKKITDIYFIPPKSWRLVYNYVREIGLRFVLRKIISRYLEKGRNDKFLSCGVGTILEGSNEQLAIGVPVIFLAPCESRCMERVVLDASLVMRVDDNFLSQSISEIYYYNLIDRVALSSELKELSGWNIFSGTPLSKAIPSLLLEAQVIIQRFRDAQKQSLDVKKKATILERSHKKILKLRKPQAVLFGYGQYAKTEILPNIKKYIQLCCIHEIDPTQIANKLPSMIIDTSPVLRDFEKYDICFIAGYHHTHAPIAIEASNKKMAIVSEKPLVTSFTDLHLLIDALKKNKTPYYSAFQKRYSVFNSYIHKDLQCQLGEAISYSCLVFEVPLPKLHWYNWPNSKNRILSNGCHWIDHFLFLNNFAKPIFYSVHLAKNGQINTMIELENGAVFTMRLTDIGSNRIGLQEYIELRAKTNTVKIINSSAYIAENYFSIIRKIKINKLSPYQRMYEQIAKKYCSGDAGDSIASIQLTSELVLQLEEALIKCKQGAL